MLATTLELSRHEKRKTSPLALSTWHEATALQKLVTAQFGDLEQASTAVTAGAWHPDARSEPNLSGTITPTHSLPLARYESIFLPMSRLCRRLGKLQCEAAFMNRIGGGPPPLQILLESVCQSVSHRALQTQSRRTDSVPPQCWLTGPFWPEHTDAVRIRFLQKHRLV